MLHGCTEIGNVSRFCLDLSKTFLVTVAYTVATGYRAELAKSCSWRGAWRKHTTGRLILPGWGHMRPATVPRCQLSVALLQFCGSEMHSWFRI